MKKIKLNATQVKKKKVEVYVSEQDVKMLVESGLIDIDTMRVGVRKQFLTAIGLSDDYERIYINKNGEWEHSWEVRGGSHGWDDEEVIRPATENEKIFEESLDAIVHAFTVAKLEGESVGD